MERPLRTRLLALTVVMVGLATVTGPATANELDDARTQKEAVHANVVKAAEQLAQLGAQEDEIRRRLDALDEAVAEQKAKVEAAKQAVVSAEKASAERAKELAATNRKVAEGKVQSVDIVVAAYVGAASGGDETRVFFDSADIGQAVAKQQLLNLVNGKLSAQVDKLKALAQDQERVRRDAQRAVSEAARLRAEAAAAQHELDHEYELQTALEAQLQGQIGDWKTKAAEVEAEEAKIDEIIRVKTAEINGRAASIALVKPAESFSYSEPKPKASVGSSSGSGYVWPADGPLTSSFGYRRHPILGTVRLHAGVDVGADYGSPVWAPKAGEVIFAGWNGGYGNCIMIQHNDGIVTLYGHMSELVAGEGQRVSQGTIIGYIGSTGSSTGPHLHFETRIGDEPVDPLGYLP